MNGKDLRDYHDASATGMPGDSLGGAIGYGEYLRKEAERQKQFEAASSTWRAPPKRGRADPGSPPREQSGTSSIAGAAALLGALLGAIFGAEVGIEGGPLAGMLAGAVAGVLLTPLIKVAVVVAAWAIKVAFYVALLAGVLWLLASLGGG
jgi:hypothetical protein